MRLSERSEFVPRRLIRASQGTHNDSLWASMSGALSFGTFSLGKDKSVWSRFEQPKAGPKGEVQDRLHKRYSPIRGETLSLNLIDD